MTVIFIVNLVKFSFFKLIFQQLDTVGWLTSLALLMFVL